MVLYLSLFQPFGLYRPSDYTIFLQLLGVLSLTLGYLMRHIRITTTNSFDKLNIQEGMNRLYSNRLFQLGLLVVTAYLVSLMITFIDTVVVKQTLDTHDFREGYFDSSNNIYGPLFAHLNTYVFVFLIPALYPLFCYGLLYKRNWVCLTSFVCIMAYNSLGGGRFGYIRMLLPLIPIILLMQTNNNKVIIKKSQKVFFLLILGGTMIAMIAASAFRYNTIDVQEGMNIGWEKTSEHLVTYSVGSTVAFDQAIKTNRIDKIGGYHLGLITLQPFYGPFQIILAIAGINTEHLTQAYNYYKGEDITVGNGLGWNALYTWNLPFYCDLGLIGILLFNFIFGYLIRAMILRLYKYSLVGDLVIYTILTGTLILSPVDANNFSPMVFIFVVLVFLYERRFIRKRKYGK